MKLGIVVIVVAVSLIAGIIGGFVAAVVAVPVTLAFLSPIVVVAIRPRKKNQKKEIGSAEEDETLLK